MTSYDEVSIASDVIELLSVVFDVTFDEVPPILQFELWKQDFKDFVESTLNGAPDLDFTV